MTIQKCYKINGEIYSLGDIVEIKSLDSESGMYQPYKGKLVKVEKEKKLILDISTLNNAEFKKISISSVSYIKKVQV